MGMKSLALFPLLFAGLLFAGCASDNSLFSPVSFPSGPAPTATASSPAPQPIVTPAASVAGKVARYVDAGRFVVLSFPVGHMPKAGANLFLYRNGLKVAEIKVSGPETEHFTVADILTGDAQAGDETREQ